MHCAELGQGSHCYALDLYLRKSLVGEIRGCFSWVVVPTGESKSWNKGGDLRCTGLQCTLAKEWTRYGEHWTELDPPVLVRARVGRTGWGRSQLPLSHASAISGHRSGVALLYHPIVKPEWMWDGVQDCTWISA